MRYIEKPTESHAWGITFYRQYSRHFRKSKLNHLTKYLMTNFDKTIPEGWMEKLTKIEFSI